MNNTINKKIIIAIPVIIVIFVAVLVLMNHKAVFSCADQLYDMNVTTLDEIPNLRMYTYQTNAISYFECSENKQRIVDLCEKIAGVKACNENVATIYLMYLYKTGRTEAPEILSQMLYKSLSMREYYLSQEEISEAIGTFLDSESETVPYTGDLAVLKGYDEFISEADESMAVYFQNIQVFRDATDADDCQRIVFGDPPNAINLLFKDACRLAFVEDRDEYCWNLTEVEINACLLF